MRVLIFIIGMIGSASLVTSVSAQSIFGFGTKNTSTTQAPAVVTPPANKVMTPEQFRSKVNTLEQESRTPANNQINQILNAKQPGPPEPADTTKTTTTTPAASSTGAGSPTAPAAQPNAAPAPTSAPAPGGTTLPAAQAPVGSKPVQPQPYTGFGVPANQGGANNSGNTGNTNNSSKNTGWNIKY